MVYFHSSLLFSPDVSFNTFSSFRSIPYDYSFSTERRFIGYACTSPMIDLLSSFIQHSLALSFNANDSRHTFAQRGGIHVQQCNRLLRRKRICEGGGVELTYMLMS